MKAQKFFRYLWRIDAILILLAAGAITFGIGALLISELGGGYSETRNILFINPAQKTAYWLLPDNDHIIEERSDVKDEKDPTREGILATAVLVKPHTDQSESATGRLLVFDASGKNIVEVAN